jgi:predicted RND superfamily exporter protein
MLARLAYILTRYKTSFFLGCLFFLGLLALGVQKPSFSGQLEGWNLASNPEYRALIRKDSIFGKGEKVFIRIQPHSNDRTEVLRAIGVLEKELLRHFPDGEVLSPLTFYQKMRQHWQGQDRSLSEFLRSAQEVPLLRQLIARDAQSFLLIVTLPELAQVDTDELDLTLQVAGGEVFQADSLSEVHLAQAIETSIRKDLLIILFLISGIFLGYFLFSFRHIGALVYMVTLIALSLVTTWLLFSLLGFTINIISIIVFPVVLILALSDSIHLVTGFQQLGQGEPREERIRHTLERYIVPSFLSSFTTAAAFFSFYWYNESAFIREFGLITAVALMVEFLIAFLMAPFLLNLIPRKPIRAGAMLGVAAWMRRNKQWFSFGLVLVLVASLFFVSDLRIESGSDTFFPRGSKVRQLNQEFKANYFSPLEANLIIGAKAGAKVPMDTLQSYVRQIAQTSKGIEGVVEVQSATDSYWFENRMGLRTDLFRHLGKRNPYFEPDSRQFLIQCQFQRPSDIPPFADYWRNMPIQAGIDLEVSSTKLMMDTSSRMLSISLLKSLITAGLTIFLIILLLTRSIWIAAMSMVPNFIPLGFIVLIYGLFDANLTMITSLTLVIGLGLLDDDTIHILYRRLWLRAEMEELNFSILSSGFLLVIAFLSFGVSHFFPVQEFGMVAAMVFLVGVVCEMTIMVWVLDKVVDLRTKREQQIK